MKPAILDRSTACSAAALALLASACVSAPTAPPPSSTPGVSIFAVAHQDDWQLFMNPMAYRAMDEPQEKAVFIHVTAGDAGRGLSGEPIPYYLAREEGALRAVRFMANAANTQSGLGAIIETTRPQIAGHAIARHAYANAVVYFLRVPDGFIVEGDVMTPHPGSLARLRAKEIAETQSIDGVALYAGWDDLVATLAAIVAAEQVAGSRLTIHTQEPDEALNPGEHPDHRATALAMLDAAQRFPCAAVTRHDTYDTRRRRPNVTGEDYMIDVGVWAATASGLSDSHAPGTWEPVHNSWIGRSYARTTPPAPGCDGAPTS